MTTAAIVAAVFVALQHLGFLVLEMFLFRGPIGQKVFRVDAAFAQRSAVMMANQGLYNGFLAAGIVFTLFVFGLPSGRATLTFFLVCVLVAGVFGGFTVSQRITAVQAVPAALALGLLWLS